MMMVILMNGNLYFFFGLDEYLIKNRTEKVLSDQGVDVVDVEVFDMEETTMEDAVNAAMTIPFLSDKKAVILKNCSFLTPVAKGKDSDLNLAYLTRYLRNPNPTTVFILQAPYEKLDARKPIVKVIQETCKAEECLTVKKEDLFPMVKASLEKAGKTMDADALGEFVNRTSDNTLLALNELEKLFQYVDTKTEIDIQTVRKVTCRNLEDNIFELVNAILAKDTRAVTRIYQDLSEVSTEPTMILSLITGKFQEILYTKELLRMKCAFEDIMKYFNASKGRTYYIVKNARDLSDDLLARYMIELEKIDFRIKSGALDKKIGLELFLLGI